MHAFDKMFDGPMHRWLLWDQHWMIQQLYRLRELGLLSKVSEIDRLRQFTTKYTLADVMQRIAVLAQELAARQLFRAQQAAPGTSIPLLWRLPLVPAHIRLGKKRSPRTNLTLFRHQ